MFAIKSRSPHRLTLIENNEFDNNDNNNNDNNYRIHQIGSSVGLEGMPSIRELLRYSMHIVHAQDQN